MTDLVPQQEQENLQALADVLNLQEILTRIADRKAAAEPEVPHKAPQVVPVSPAQQKALQHLTRDLKDTVLPDERRVLTTEEQHSLIRLGADAKAVEKTVKVAVAAIKTAVFNHFDVRLEEDKDEEGILDLPYDPDSGHYLVDCELVVEDLDLKFSRELRQASPDLTAEHLLSLYEDDKITRKDYLDATRQVRVVDEDGLMKVIRRDPSILLDIEEIIEPGKVTASFYIRPLPKNKD